MNETSKFRYGVQISDNMLISGANGFLECHNVPIARTGTQEYMGKELPDYFELNEDEKTVVVRTPDDVFSEQFMSSLENVPLTIYHPNSDVDTSNIKELGNGFVRNVRKGRDRNLIVDERFEDKNGNNTLFADVVVTTEEAIKLIRNGEMREVSVGYDAMYLKDKKGNIKQVPTKANHLALCPRGRAITAVIRDSKVADDLKPLKNENQKSYVQKFMNDAEMIEKYPNEQDRLNKSVVIFEKYKDFDTFTMKSNDMKVEFENMSENDVIDIINILELSDAFDEENASAKQMVYLKSMAERYKHLKLNYIRKNKKWLTASEAEEDIEKIKGAIGEKN